MLCCSHAGSPVKVKVLDWTCCCPTAHAHARAYAYALAHVELDDSAWQGPLSPCRVWLTLPRGAFPPPSLVKQTAIVPTIETLMGTSLD